MTFRSRIAPLLALVFLTLPLGAAEAPRVFPLWDGKEAVATYAERVHLPATKSLDLGNGVTLDLVLIPAGQFIMGSEEPAKPSVTVPEAEVLIGIGICAMWVSLLLLSNNYNKKKTYSFSLRWLILLTISTGLCLGGIARRILAQQEAARYETELAAFNKLPPEEKPAHSVTLTQPFYMGKYTVTQEQYSAIMGTTPSRFKGAQLPVESMMWNDVTAFCAKLTEKLKNKALSVRLPTEAQWEYACRAGTRTRFYSGDLDGDLDAVGWYYSNSGRMPHPVGQKKANAFGLYDMVGNMEQYCEDNNDAKYYSISPELNPIRSEGETDRVLRGACYADNLINCRSSYRYHVTPKDWGSFSGFRVMLSSTL